MKKMISFAQGEWENEGLLYAYSWRFPALPTFRQEADHIKNGLSTDPRQHDPYDYMGLVFPTPFHTGARCSAKCSFEALGAPMLVVCDKSETDENGIFRTLNYFELVLYRNGLNVWRMETEDRKVSYHNVLRAYFPVAENETHSLSAEVRDKRLLIQADGQRLELYAPELTPSFHLGYTACEGVCRLYEMTAEDETKTDNIEAFC